MIQSKSLGQNKSVNPREVEAKALMDRLTSGIVLLEPEERPRDSLSSPLISTCNRTLTPMEIKTVLNSQIPKKWRRKISEIVW